MQWTTSLAIGISQNLSVLVVFLLSLSYDDLILILGSLLAKKYATAVVQSATHADEFTALSVDVPEEILDSWTTKILTWEHDREQPNLYFNPSSGTSYRIVYPGSP